MWDLSSAGNILTYASPLRVTFPGSSPVANGPSLSKYSSVPVQDSHLTSFPSEVLFVFHYKALPPACQTERGKDTKFSKLPHKKIPPRMGRDFHGTYFNLGIQRASVPVPPGRPPGGIPHQGRPLRGLARCFPCGYGQSSQSPPAALVYISAFSDSRRYSIPAVHTFQSAKHPHLSPKILYVPHDTI